MKKLFFRIESNSFESWFVSFVVNLKLIREDVCDRWKNRSHAVLSDLKNLDADFLCLQAGFPFSNFFIYYFLS